MFPRGYFPAGYFTPAYFPPVIALVEEVDNRGVPYYRFRVLDQLNAEDEILLLIASTHR